VRLTPRIQPGDGAAAVGPQLDRHVRPGAAQPAHEPAQHQHEEAAAVGVAWSEHRRDQLAGVAVEDQEWVVHVLLIEAVVGDTLLVAMGGIVGAIDIDQHLAGWSVPAALADVEVDERDRQSLDGVAVDGVLQPGEGRLAGKIRTAVRQPAADQFEQRVVPPCVGVVLVFVAAGNLIHALAHEPLQAVLAAAAAPVRDAVGERGTERQRRIRLRQPGQPAITGQAPAIERGQERHAGTRRKARGRCRLGHRSTVRVGIAATPILRLVLPYGYLSYLRE
jgi:hypothetical protein